MKSGINKIENFKEYLNVFNVFGNFPFFEKWTQEEVRLEFDNNLATGHIFGYYEDDICVGFISMREQHPHEHPIHYGHESKVLYISDLAVLPNYRNRGIGTKLFEYALTIAKSEGYDFAYLRVNEKNPMGLEIFKKYGFKKEYDICEIVSRPHTRISIKNPEEFRIFMSKKL